MTAAHPHASTSHLFPKNVGPEIGFANEGTVRGHDDQHQDDDAYMVTYPSITNKELYGG